jgi:hypothetical protein
MAAALKFIVLPFKKARAGIVPGEMRQASNAASAERIAASMASRFVGVVALSAMADGETGDLSEARLLASYGETGDLSAMMELSAEEAEEENEQEPAQEVAAIEKITPLEMQLADEIEPVQAEPLPASSLILTSPPEPASTKRVVRALTKRPRPPAPSAGPLFEQEPFDAR